MTHPLYLCEKARSMRVEKHLTIDEIAERLALSRSTIYHWVRDLPMPAPVGGWHSTAARRQGTKAMQERYTLRRKHAYAHGLETFEVLASEPTFRDFVCLYIAEGYKRDRNAVSLASSDPAVIKVANAWIRRLSRNQVRYAIQYHRDQDLNELISFWGGELGVEPSSIALQRKSNSNQLTGRTWRSRYGVLTIRACDTMLRAQLQAWMDRIRSEWV